MTATKYSCRLQRCKANINGKILSNSKIMHHNHSILQVNVPSDGRSHNGSSQIQSQNISKAGAFAVNENPRRDHSTHEEIATIRNQRHCKACHPDLDELPSKTTLATRLLIPDSAQESTRVIGLCITVLVSKRGLKSTPGSQPSWYDH